MNTVAKLEAFLKLPDGWKYGKGKPVSKIAFSSALRLSEYTSDLGIITDAFMGSEGDVTLALYQKNKDFWFHITAGGEFSFGSEMQDIEIEYNLCIEDCLKKIALISRDASNISLKITSPWTSSFSYTLKTTMRDLESSEAQLSSHQVMEAVYPLFQVTAFEKKAESVSTQVNTTPVLYQPQSFSFNSTRPQFQLATF